MKTLLPSLLASALLLPTCALADVSYQETTEITGGSMMGMAKMAGAFSSQAKQALQPTTSTVMIHGGRMVSVDPHTTSIIDLDAQTITSIDHDKRSYYVMTFQQMQQAMADAAAKMKASKPSTADASQMTFDAHISTTGATRQLNGETAHEALLTITMVANSSEAAGKAGMAATSEMWLIKDAPGMAELKRFNERMAKELAVTMNTSAMTSLLAAEPGGAQALEELKKESAKVTGGYPALQVTRVGMTLDGKPLAAPSVAPLPQSQTQNPNHGSVAGAVGKDVAVGTATQEASSGISKLGGFGRALGGSGMGSLLGHMPSSKPAPASASAANTDPATAAVMMENQTAMSGFSVAAVDTNSFAIPAGYKLVASPLAHK